MGRKEKVTKVIDGDTFETASRKHPVRLANVEAPEKGEPGATKATQALRQLIQGEEVTIECEFVNLTNYSLIWTDPIGGAGYWLLFGKEDIIAGSSVSYLPVDGTVIARGESARFEAQFITNGLGVVEVSVAPLLDNEMHQKFRSNVFQLVVDASEDSGVLVAGGNATRVLIRMFGSWALKPFGGLPVEHLHVDC